MDYSPWSEREISLFLRVAVSPKPERSHPPKSVYMHVTSMPTCLNFLSQFRSIKFFGDHGLYSPWSKRKNWPFLKGTKMSYNSETGEATPTKIGVHTYLINTYLHKFFEPIPID